MESQKFTNNHQSEKPPLIIDFWVYKLRRLGLPLTPAKLTACYIAKHCAKLPPNLRGVWIAQNFNEKQNRKHAALVQKIRYSGGWLDR